MSVFMKHIPFILMMIGAYLISCNISENDVNEIAGSIDNFHIDCCFPVKYQTNILQVKIEPDTIVVGDSVRFTCVISDSLDKDFYFEWSIAPFDSAYPTHTDENIHTVMAPDSLGTFFCEVTVKKDFVNSAPPTKRFKYKVLSKLK